ncbi:MAG: ABC transporter ATP-binding protein [Solirubrobacterales bacterium]|nr:ABC transporter ATP-binding protein [Solirubrobacterales bacterium]
MAAVRASGLVKRFESTCAVDGVELVLAEGEVRGLLGPNGAGKTTLLRLLFGLLTPDAGEIDLLGRPLGSAERVSLDGVAGFVEEPAFYPYLSGRVNLELLAELDRSPQARARVDEVLAQVGLAGRATDRVSGYSTGMRQRLGIAAALLRSPKVLLLDEPTSGLDPVGVREVGALLRRLAAEGTAVLLSSHLIGATEDVCDSYTVLRRGRVVWSGSSELLREQAPGSAYRLQTSDDARALELAAQHRGIELVGSGAGELRIAVQAGALDPFVLSLGRAGIAVRRLELLLSPLESMFFALTGEADPDAVGIAEVAEAVLAGA